MAVATTFASSTQNYSRGSTPRLQGGSPATLEAMRTKASKRLDAMWSCLSYVRPGKSSGSNSGQSP